ncbi:hypothetical protein Syun_017971 [Stephania yunnanensis]|uniref:F-box domain-containing protein n=1 Tax=Stephania yunnanensis TaxID=152371 RepID=A0AAP0NVT3_9MAGN
MKNQETQAAKGKMMIERLEYCASSTSSTCSLLEKLIVYEILPRIHIKSLIRFKLVCKKWLSLITRDPLFITRHSQIWMAMGRRSDGLLFESGLDNTPDFLVDRFLISTEDGYSGFKLDIDKYWSIESTSNGVVYCVNKRDDMNRSSVIFNPVTKCMMDIGKIHCEAVALVFDPLNSSFMLIGADFTDTSNRFKVFSSKTGKWRLSKSTLCLPYEALANFIQSHVYVQGKLHWLEWTGIAWFDIEEDAAGVIPYPHEIDPEAQDVNRFSDIGVTLGGRLRYSKMIDGVTQVWLLSVKSKFEFEWEKIHTLVMERIIEDNWEALDNPYFTTPEALTENNASLFNCQLEDAIVFRLLKLLSEDHPSMYILYNFTTGKAKMIKAKEKLSLICFKAFKICLSPVPDFPK